ncbi:pilin N-terminal domain-containing protein [Anaerococcus hydrogenalis]|uniref:pilin N-terminal domain-containing protein n=1 Tax=Anaerococcus hydrogenalis TaxID=33029 RepID=UPI001D4997FC|nr:pilin N-terminal domain-containing protein [Anaerococcus hydrogenalis]MBS5989251.1 isopeptide-forming domain-containing fimbrial protein [Anaerococcus hydrogenalis]
MKHKILSFLTAFAMVFGIIAAPFVNASAAEEAKYENSTNKINIHKILFKKEADYNAWDSSKHKTSYIKDEDLASYFENKAEEIAGVAYDIYKEEDATEEKAANGSKLNTDFNTTEFKSDKHYSIARNDLITKEKGTGDVELADGSYVIVENADRTTYQDPTTGQTVSKQGKAIPVRITLPAALPVENTTGVLHLYPKNTTVDSPDTEKNFTDRIKIADANNDEKQNAKNNEENYKVSGVGQPVPYTVETVFKPNTNFKNAYWNDQMTKGLDFTQADLDAMKIYVNGEDKTSSFDKKMDGNGYKVVLKDMTLVNGKDANVTVRLEYSAKLNDKSKVEIPESNDVTFHYGNNPSEGNTPKPQTPEKGKIKVTKTFEDKLNNKKPAKLLVQLYNANTGKKEGEAIDLAQNNWTYEWSNLNADYQYKVVEVSTDYEVVYGLGQAGEITIKNNENDNPTPKNPQEPKVVRYGKKFVKADEKDGKRLNGAKFVVKHEKENKYLVKKTAEELAADKAAYDKVVAEYDAIYKNPKADQTQLDAKFEEVKAKAEALNNKYKWADATDKKAAEKLANVVTLEPKENGKFEITDLQLGKYNLEEVAAPKDYAVRDGAIPFEVTTTSYNKDDSKIGVVYEGTDNVVNKAEGADAQRVDNRNLTIPQTGGIGSIIFVVAGLMIMGLAAYKMKANKEQA